MKVVDNSNVCHTIHAHAFDDCELILRLSEPATMVVKCDNTTLFAGCFSYSSGSGSLRFHSRLLFFGVMRRFACTHDPELGSDAVTFEHIEDEASLIIKNSWKPPGQQIDFVPLKRLYLGIEARHMFGTIIIGE